MEETITDLSQIDWRKNQESRLLFTALTILTVEVFPKNTPDEVIMILHEKANSFLNDDKTEHEKKLHDLVTQKTSQYGFDRNL